jgi:hypothetical protein
MTIPESGAARDWPRRVAQAVNQLLRGAQGFERLSVAPVDPFEGRSYYDTTLQKVRTWDGSAWQGHW